MNFKIISCYLIKDYMLMVYIHTQWCPALYDLIDCSLPSSPIHGIFQARVLKWVAISFTKESSQPRD